MNCPSCGGKGVPVYCGAYPSRRALAQIANGKAICYVWCCETKPFPKQYCQRCHLHFGFMVPGLKDYGALLDWAVKNHIRPQELREKIPLRRAEKGEEAALAEGFRPGYDTSCLIDRDEIPKLLKDYDEADKEEKGHRKDMANCPLCGAKKSSIRIVYGLIRSRVFDILQSRGVVVGGGCCIDPNYPSRHCTKCGKDWGDSKKLCEAVHS